MEQNGHGLPPKASTIDRLVTKPADIRKVIEGKKTAVRRSGRHADPGEVMELDGHRFEMAAVYQQTLGEMDDSDAIAEGFANLEEYKQSILSIHPGMKWIPGMAVWVHEFRPSGD